MIRALLACLPACLLVAIAAVPVSAAEPAAEPSNNPQEFLQQAPRPNTLKAPFKLISIGDLLYSYPMAHRDDAELQQVIMLIQSGDVTIANREGATLDAGTHTAGYGDGLLWAEGDLAADEKAMGVGMVSLANNHSMDWGDVGLRDTIRLHQGAGIVTAGGGENLAEARQAAILETPKGRVALISTASSFKANARANDALEMTAARAGISTLRTRIIHLVNEQQFAAVRKLATELASTLKPAPAADATEITLEDETYRLSRSSGLSYEMELYDHAALLKSIRDARQQADLIVFTIHAHQSSTGDDDDTPPPPDFLVRLFHDAVDAGADVIMGGGPHSLRGVEIYKGRPILYGLGAFFINGDVEMTQESALRVFPDASGHAPPPDPPQRSVRKGGNPASWYDGVVAVTEFERGQARRVLLYPLDLGNTYDRKRRGIPHLATAADAQRILKNLESDSAQFGTRIVTRDSVGIIDIPPVR
jgi:poly-gamma-glutamate capsule biosynthesis protein CapA/YwtB (metallophosphatase superfamily)